MAKELSQKERARRRKANQRARDNGLPEPYPSLASVAASEEQAAVRDARHREDLSWAVALDATGKFYKSECRTLVTLLGIYEGGALNVICDEEDELAEASKKPKQRMPIPSVEKITIPAIFGWDGEKPVKIETTQKEYREEFEVNEVVSFRRWLDLRDKARKDLFWLCRLLGNTQMFHDTHQMLCDQFVQKNFDGLFFPGMLRSDVEEAINEQKRETRVEVGGKIETISTKTMMLFAPRSGFKSTINGMDAIQWMLNVPDIRIMIMTSVRNLASKFMGEIKRKFYLPSRGQATAFQKLFPEYILTGVAGRSSGPITCPAKTYETKEDHVWISSMDSSYVGLRCDIRKLDDVVEDKNSLDDELRETLKNKIAATEALVEPWGFTDVIGTRYFTNDWYGFRMSKDEEGNEPEPFKYVCVSAYTPKPGREAEFQKLLNTPNGVFKITEDMVDLWFPYKLGWKALQTKLRQYKERGFKNQYLNIATDPQQMADFICHFNRQLLLSHTYAATAAPKEGDVVLTFDFAFSDSRTSDFSVLAASRIHRRPDNTSEMVVIEIEFDKWRSSELALQAVLFIRKYPQAKRIIIEKINGADLLKTAMNAHAIRYGVDLSKVELRPPSNEPNAKANRVKTLELLFKADRLHIVSGPWIDETYKQFENFTGETKKGRKDDIPDAIAQAATCLPASVLIKDAMGSEEYKTLLDKEEKDYIKKHNHERMFGSGYGLTTMHGSDFLPMKEKPSVAVEITPPKPQDPRLRVFGNRGPWRL
ncbi:Uncharacterised protein [uncultured archaeon]|nr:Uncharacterised protein [uncultured archaeon]